jgi:hypothetical protein
MFSEAQMRAGIAEAEALNKHLMSTTARLKVHRITETRGPASVVINGVGDVLEVHIEGVDPEVLDCVVAALRAAQGHAQQGYEAFLAGRR